MTIKVLFVCLGNICRSPMAEAVFQQMVDTAALGDKIQVDSAGTGPWHVGEKAHRGTRRILSQHNIPYNGRARQVTPADTNDPDTYIVAMDQSNLSTLQSRYGKHPRLYRLLDFASHHDVRDVPDPYYNNNFEYVYELVTDGCQGLLATIRQKEGI